MHTRLSINSNYNKDNNMKKLLLVITLSLLLLLAGCSQGDEEMTIFPAGFTAKERDLMWLLGKENDQHIFDFLPGKDVKTMDITVWKLNGKEWEELHKSSRQFVDERGRIAFEFDNIGEYISIALQSETNSGRVTNTGKEVAMRVSATTSCLNKTEKIVYGKEIPLIVQVVTTKNMVTAHGVESFENPEVYLTDNYEYVYAVTVKFDK